MEKLKKIGSVLGRSEMRKIMAGSGGQQCNCLYCHDGLGVFQTYYVSNCDYDPTIACQSLGGYSHGNYGLC